MASIAPVARPRPLTYDDYCLLPEDDSSHELIEGELFVSPSPNTWHQVVSKRLQFELMSQLEVPRIAIVFNAPMDVLLEHTSVVQPDLLVIRSDRKHLITPRCIQGAPDLVVEILSPSTIDRDQFIKRRLYERFAIPEYWVVDPVAQRIVVWRMTAEGYGIRATLERDATLTSPDFPALVISLAKIFEAL